MMTNKTLILAFIMVFAVALSLMPEMAMAQSALTGNSLQTAGGAFTNTFVQTLQGNIGLLIGLGIAFFGLWTWIMSQNSWGIVMIIGGIAVTAFPGLFDGVANTLRPVFSTIANGSSTAGEGGLQDNGGELKNEQ